VPQRRKKVTPVIGDDDAGTGCTRYFRDVRIIDAAASGFVLSRGREHGCAIRRRKIVHGHAGEDFFLKEMRGVRGREPEFRR
jgi:hypothetical protein